MKLDIFIKKAKNIILDHLDDEGFNVGKLAEYLNLSRSQTLRKIKGATGFSANEFIREVKLEKALELLEDEKLTISEISYRVGFNNPSYFNKCFHDRYHYSPGEYREKVMTKSLTEAPHYKSSGMRFVGLAAVAFAFLIVWLYQSNFSNNSSKSYSSMVILPLQDYTEGQDKEYLALGLTDALTSELSKIKGLRVPSRGSALHFQDSLKVYSEISDVLDVDLILEGSIIKEGAGLKVILQLIDPSPVESHIWRENFDMTSTNIIQLSALISERISEELEMDYTRDQSMLKIVQKEAEEYMLKGRQMWQKKHPEEVDKAINYLNKAIELEPEYSLAYYNLARAYMAKNELSQGNLEDRYLMKNKNREPILDALNKAILYNNSMADAYIFKGLLLGKFDWDWEGMKEVVDKGLEYNPNSIAGHELLSDYYTIIGKPQLAVNEAVIAKSLDPLNLDIASKLANKYIYNGDFIKAENLLKEVLDLDIYYPKAYDDLGFLYYLDSNKDLSLEMFTNLHVLLKNPDLVEFYSTHNFDDSMAFWLDRVNSGEKMYCRTPHIIAMANQLGGRTDKTIEYLQLAYDYEYSELPVAMMHPVFDNIRNTPEFVAIAEKVGITSNF